MSLVHLLTIDNHCVHSLKNKRHDGHVRSYYGLQTWSLCYPNSLVTIIPTQAPLFQSGPDSLSYHMYV